MSSPDQAASGVGPQSEGPSLGLLDPDRALELVLERAPGPQAAKRLLQNSFGARILEPILASLPQPSFSRALMDGFAVRIEDAGRKVTCTGEVLAGRTPGPEVEPGKAVAVMTGAPCPRGSEAVVMIEDVERDGERLLLPRVISPGQHLQAAGSLCMPGDVILPAGSIMTSVALAAATAAGVAEITVGRAPAVAIITTGDELSAPDTTLGQAQIFDSNGPMLKALAIATGAEHALLLHAADTVESLTDALAEAANEDIVVLSGGVGVGRRDLVPGVLSALGYDKVFHKVSQQPGMPLFFAVKGEQLAFGLPGTPLGCHLGFHRYVSAAIRKRIGLPRERPMHKGRLSTGLVTRGSRTLFRLALVELEPGGWTITPLGWRGSSDLMGTARANSYLRFPPGEHSFTAGQALEFELLSGAGEALHG